MSKDSPSIQTKLVRPDMHGKMVGGVSTTIERSTTFAHKTASDFADAARGFIADRSRTDFYSRIANPTNVAVASRIAEIECAEEALLFSSGMAAISTVLLSSLQNGDHAICQTPLYGHTQSFVESYLPNFGVSVDFVESASVEQIKSVLTARTRLILVETPSNPHLNIVDIAEVAGIAHEHDVMLAVDSTFATPYLQQPLKLGASVVIHSATKFLSGHSDVVCGVVAGSADLIGRLHEWQMRLGTVLDPHAAWLLDRGIKTLAVRMRQHCENAEQVVAFLAEQHDIVAEVYYPGHSGGAGRAIVQRQMPSGAGGVLSFKLRGGRQAARTFVDTLQIVSIATSLGGIESLIQIPSDIVYSTAPVDTPSDEDILIRFSVGIEAIEDLLDDIQGALSAARTCL